MEWSELKEEAKKMGCSISYEGTESELIDVPTNANGELAFYKNGNIKAFEYPDSVDLFYDIKPKQMLAIMKALQ